MKTIALQGKNGKGKCMIVDDEDFDYLTQWRWNLIPSGYVVRTQYLGKDKSKTIYLHTTLLKHSPRQVIDHINGNKLDNQKRNLRACLKRQNSYNMVNLKKSRNGFIGITEVKPGNWRAHLWDRGIVHNKQGFKTPLEAAIYRDKLVKKVHGEFAVLNFPIG